MAFRSAISTFESEYGSGGREGLACTCHDTRCFAGAVDEGVDL